MKTSKTTIAFLAALLVPAMMAAADEMADLRAKFLARDAKVLELKKAGTLGETYLGYLDSPKGATGEAQTVMTDENADRKRLYELIAAKEGATADTVASRNAQRNFSRAAKGEMLKYPDGWRTK